jgi:protoporphyrinogen oxidase
MSTEPQTICILGAGPAGIAAAFFAQQKGFKVVLVEEKDWVGGKGASRKVDQYLFDFGPHAYHPKSESINNLVQSHAGEDYLKSVVKMDLILKGKHMSYPFNFKEALVKFNPMFSLKILSDYLLVKLKNFFKPLPEKSFYDWGIKQFGKTLYDLCFGNYTERVWKVPARNLSVELAKRKLPRFSIFSLVQDLFFRKGRLHAHIFTNELGYHREGIGQVYQNIVSGIVQRGGVLFTGSSVHSLEAKASLKRIKLEIRGESSQSIDCDYIVSTIPLPELLHTLGHADQSFLSQVPELSFRHILLVYVVLNRVYFSRAHWIYLVDERFHFHRISEQKNLSSLCSPENQTVLTMEISCSEDDPMWGWGAEQFRGMVMEDLVFFDIPAGEIAALYLSKLEDAYPIYTIDYEKKLTASLEELAKIPQLITTGRQGLFLDIDMHDAMVLGKKSVDALLNGTVSDFYAENTRAFKRPA